jgi:hypothetical protein
MGREAGNIFIEKYANEPVRSVQQPAFIWKGNARLLPDLYAGPGATEALDARYSGLKCLKNRESGILVNIRRHRYLWTLR